MPHTVPAINKHTITVEDPRTTKIING